MSPSSWSSRAKRQGGSPEEAATQAASAFCASAEASKVSRQVCPATVTGSMSSGSRCQGALSRAMRAPSEKTS